MFKFLKLRNSVSGDARRHVPFTSIIHKPLFILFAIVFSLMAVVPVKVKAMAAPQFNPISGTDLNTFIGGYNAAGPELQSITNILLGAQAMEYAGLGDYATKFSQLPDDATVWDRLELIGEQIVEDFFAPYNAADRALTNVINYAQGALNFAKGFVSKLEFINHVNSLQNFYLSYDHDFGIDINQYFAQRGGLFNWNQSYQYFSPDDFYFEWYFTDISDNQINANYYAIFDSLPDPKVRGNEPDPYSNKNEIAASNFFSVYKYIFVNTSNNQIYICDDSGNRAPSSFQAQYLKYIPYVTASLENTYFYTNTLSMYNFNSLSDLFFSLSSNPVQLISNDSQFRPNYSWRLCLSDFIENLYYGDSWSDKKVWDVLVDLGFGTTDSLQVLNPKIGTELLFDLKGLVNGIVAAQPDPAYELPLQPIIYNITQVDGAPLTAQDLEGISFNVTPPESGIDVPVNAFLPMFDNGKGFISYMWYMTKPLIAYTRSLLDALTFDPVDGFNASGPGYFVLGVAGLGLIGGVIVKFLL